MAHRRLASCSFALLAIVLAIVPQSAQSAKIKAAEDAQSLQELLAARAAAQQQGNDQPQQQDPPPPQGGDDQTVQQNPPPQTPAGERPQAGCGIKLLGVQTPC